MNSNTLVKQYRNNKLHGSTTKNRTSFKYFANIKKDPRDYQATDTVETDTSLQSETVLADDEQKVFQTVPAVKECKNKESKISLGENHFEGVSVSEFVEEKLTYSSPNNVAVDQQVLVEKNLTTNKASIYLFIEQDNYKDKPGHSTLCKSVEKSLHLENNVKSHIGQVIPNGRSAESGEVSKENNSCLNNDNFSGRIKVTSQEITSQSNVINSNKKTLQEVPALKVYKNKKLINSSQINFNGSQFVCPSEIEEEKFTYTSQVNIASNANNQLMSKANSESKTITNLLNEQQINTASSDFIPSQEVFGTTLEFKDKIKGDVEQIMIPDFTALPSGEVHNKNELCLASDKGSLNLKENKKINSEDSIIELNIYPLQENYVLNKNELNLNQNDQLKKIIVKSAANNSQYAVVLVKVLPQKSKKKEKCINRPIRTDFKCQKCRATFLSETDLNDHINFSHQTSDLNNHVKKKSFQCHKCYKKFKILSSYENHLKTTKCEGWKCSKCFKVLKSQYFYEKHLTNKTCGERFKCKICGFCNNSKNEAKAHKQTHRRFPCNECSKVFNQKHLLRKHSFVHNKEKFFECPVCKKRFFSPFYLNHHKKYVHTAVVKHVCSICNKSFKYKKHFNLHLAVHSESDPFLCSICGKQFRLKISLQIHIRRHGDKLFHCSSCGKKFFSRARLNNHMRIHTGERPFKCSVCSRSFSLIFNLKRHMELHSTEKQYQCQKCDERFYQKQGLVKHLERHDRSNFKSKEDRKCPICHVSLKELNCPISFHLEEHRKKGEKIVFENRPESRKKYIQPSQCHICGKVFLQKINLTVHLYSHANNKRFKCSICKKGFSSPSNLIRHIDQLHNRIQYLCHICGRMCSQSCVLKMHLRTHTGEKPFQCAICKRDFSDKRSLKRHLNLHSEQRLYECADCGKSFYHKISLINHIQFQHLKHK